LRRREHPDFELGGIFVADHSTLPARSIARRAGERGNSRAMSTMGCDLLNCPPRR
jgi:hypothetical protein